MNYNTLKQCNESDLRQWTQQLADHFPQLSVPQLYGLAMWSFGMLIAQSCGLSCVSAAIAALLHRKEATVRQQLREWYCEAAAKNRAGQRRRTTLQASLCFRPLLAWIISLWPPTNKHLALAMDATALGDKFTILAISVLYRRCAIAVGWKIVSGNQKGQWRPHWEELFETLSGAVPDEWKVLVLADRGLYARWLYQKIVSLG